MRRGQSRVAIAWRGLAAWLVAVVLGGCQTVAFSVLNNGASRSSPVEAHVYDDSLELKLDVYRSAANASNAPIAVFFYGGSWRNGSRADYAFVAQALASSGIITVIPDYRVFPAARFPDFEYDAAKAMRWVFDHAEEIGGDRQRIFLVGHSAGAHIAALLATDARYLASVGIAPTDIAGVVGISGPYDFLPLTDPDLIEVFGPEKDWPASQPVNFVNGDEPPFLLLQGLDDQVVWPRNSTSLQSRLRAEGVSATLITYPSVGHFRTIAGFRFDGLVPTLNDTSQFILEGTR